jgi:hypothetical protein
MTKEEYIKRFVAHICELAALSPDDEMAPAEAETFWDYVCGHADHAPEYDAEEAVSNWSE